MNNEEKRILLVDDHHGIYSWQILARTCDINLSETDKSWLLDDVYNEFYWDDVWIIENNHSFVRDGHTWHLWQTDGGIFAVRSDYEYDDLY